ncbi:MAG: hypothetical protein WD994_02235, partial [Pseudomonadales bacterium]
MPPRQVKRALASYRSPVSVHKVSNHSLRTFRFRTFSCPDPGYCLFNDFRHDTGANGPATL